MDAASRPLIVKRGALRLADAAASMPSAGFWGEGTIFTVILPASDGPEEVRSEQPVGGGAPIRVLLMDDDDLVRRMTRHVLVAAGYDVVDRAGGAEIIAAYEAAFGTEKPFHAVVLDLVVRGGMGGIETLVRLRSIDPAVRALVISGYSDDPVMAQSRSFGFLGALAKPFTAADIEEAMRRVVSGGTLTDRAR